MQNETCILATVVEDKIACLVAMACLAKPTRRVETSKLVCLRLELQMVSDDRYLKLTLVEHHRYFVSFNVHDLARFSLILALSDSHQVSWLEVLGHVGDVDLE